MSKFGELIESEIPILINFYSNWDASKEKQETAVLVEVASALGNAAKVIKIDTKLNEDLAKQLRIKTNPTFVIYQKNEMKWRQIGYQDAKTLIDMVAQFV